jgi:hypothetical protein
MMSVAIAAGVEHRSDLVFVGEAALMTDAAAHAWPSYVDAK